MTTGIMICGHGSRDEGAVREFAQVAEGLRTRMPQFDVDYGYLEFATPIIRDGLDRLREKGCKRILAVPGMLFAAGHAKNDIPSVLNTYGAQHDIEMHYGRELGVDNKMIRAAGERVREATRERGLVSVAGGGDTVAALAAAGVEADLTYVSTAGGAFLEWMEGRTLPGVAALERAAATAP
mgnify:CR=1 FL=1